MHHVIRAYRRLVPTAVRSRVPANWRRRLRRAVRRRRPPVGRSDELRELAREATGAQRWDEAAARWRVVLDTEGDRASGRTVAHLAGALRHLGEHEAGRELLREAVSSRPKDILIATEWAQLAQAEGDFDAAVERWQRVLDLEGERTTPRNLFRLARAQQRAGDWTAAEGTLADARRRHPDDARIAVAQAELATSQRDWARAVELWAQVPRSERRPPHVLVQLSRAHRHLGDLERASEVLDEALERAPVDLEVLTERAKFAGAVRDWPGAIAAWERVITTAGRDGAGPGTYRQLARCHAEQGTFDEAESALDRGLAEHPGNVILAAERPLLAALRSAWDEVEAHWWALIEARGSEVPAKLHVTLALRCCAGFNYTLADRVVSEAQRLHPTSSIVHRQYVRNVIIRERKGVDPAEWDWSEAVDRAREVIARYEHLQTPEEHLALAAELADASALEEASDLLADDSARSPDHPRRRWELATLALALGRWDEAVEHLEPLRHAGADRARATTWSVRALRCAGEETRANALLEWGCASGAVDELRGAVESAWLVTHGPDQDATAAAWRSVLERFPDRSPIAAYRQLATAELLRGEHERARSVIELGRARKIGPLEERPGVVAIVGGGPSLKGVDLQPLRSRVHTVAVNATATALPWADVAVSHDASHLAERFHDFPGPVLVGAPPQVARSLGVLPRVTYRRRLITDRLSEVEELIHSGGHTSAYTALNYAYLLRPRRIVLFGIDLTDFWTPDQYWHGTMDPYNRRRFAGLESRPLFDEWQEYRTRKIQNAPMVFASALPQLERAGIEVVNASPVSSLTSFPKVSPEEGIHACLTGGTD
jgi:tetratricopeptide (TPR) repeat protein